MNRNFGKLNGYALEYTPDTLTIEGRKVYNPKAVHYRIAGYLPVDTSAPSDPAPEGFHYEPKEDGMEDGEIVHKWQVRNGAIRINWRLVPNPPPPPRRWTRLSIKTALAQAGMLDAARQFLSASEIATGYTAWEALTDCDYIEEGYPDDVHWDEILEGATIALDKTRAEIDAFLGAIPTE